MGKCERSKAEPKAMKLIKKSETRKAKFPHKKLFTIAYIKLLIFDTCVALTRESSSQEVNRHETMAIKSEEVYRTSFISSVGLVVHVIEVNLINYALVPSIQQPHTQSIDWMIANERE